MAGPEDNVNYDDLLLGILQREGKIESFINIFLGFLFRNTDFFRIMSDPSAAFGFPPGVARAKLFESLQVFEEKSFQLYPDERKLVENAVRAGRSNKKATAAAAAAASTTTAAPVSNAVDAGSTMRNSSRASPSPSSASQSAALPQHDPSSSTPTPPPPPPPPSSLVAREEEVPPSEYQNDGDTHNGAARENYSWGQSIKDLDLRVRVDNSVKKGKQVRVAIKEDHLKVEVLKGGGGGGFETLIDAHLKWKVHPTNSMWTLFPGEHVHINFDKMKERWWNACFQDEPEIALRSIDCTRPLEELDDCSLATVNKLKFDQMQKEMGKPTSDQLKMMDQLKSGWDSDGSPFKGQPYDPSVLDFGGS